MGRSSNTLRRKEKTRNAIDKGKQTTLDNLPKAHQETAKPVGPEDKRIIITDLSWETQEDELTLKAWFKLEPSKRAFSKIVLDLYFDDYKINSVNMTLPDSPLLTDEFELTPVLDMRGINAGTYKIRVELYEPYASTEKIAGATKELAIDYVPVRKEERYVEVPFVKKIAGTDIQTISKDQENIYLEIKESLKKETLSKRDKP